MAQDLDELLDAISVRLGSLGVVAVYLFGSRANGTARPDSDIDVALLTGLGAPEARERLASEALVRLADVGDADVTVLDEAPLRLAGRVLTTGRLVFSSDEVARVRYEATTRSMFFDFEPFAAQLDRAYLDDVASGRR